jgi:hypothetical protein
MNFETEISPVKITLIQRAEFLSLYVSIISEHKTFEQQLIEISQAQRQVEDEANKTTSIRVNSTQNRLNSSSSSVGLRLITPLSGETDDFFTGAIALHKFAENLKPTGKAKYSVSYLRLGVNNTEAYRETILTMISEDINQTKKLLGSNGKVRVSGLENPVSISQKDTQCVNLFIKYSMFIEV